MGGLFSALRFSFQSLSNFSTALSVVNDNVANANTPGYTRKRVTMEPNFPLHFPFGALGTGASVTRVAGTRDLFLSRRLVTELQSQGFLQGQSSALAQIEASLFNSQGHGISEQITRFFDSFLDLTNDGSSQVLRQAVLSEGANLARGFSGATQRLNQLSADNRQRIDDTLERINNLTGRIAELNQALAPLKVNGQDGGTLQDQRQLALEQLA
ncbi:MAG: flagellar basal body protein, partial [Acidobacteriota bacterium]